MTAHVQTLLAIVLSAIALGGLLWRRLDPVVKITRYLHGEDGDERRGVAARPGILERQTASERRIQEQAAELLEMRAMLVEVLAAVRNNGGSSLRDKIEQTLAAVQSTAS